MSKHHSGFISLVKSLYNQMKKALDWVVSLMFCWNCCTAMMSSLKFMMWKMSVWQDGFSFRICYRWFTRHFQTTHALVYWFCRGAFCKAACQCLTAFGLFRGHRVSFDSTGNRLREASGVPIKSRCENSNDGPMFWICQSQSKVPSVHQITCFCVRVCVWDEKDKPAGNSLTNTPKDPVRHTRIRCAFSPPLTAKY